MCSRGKGQNAFVGCPQLGGGNERKVVGEEGVCAEESAGGRGFNRKLGPRWLKYSCCGGPSGATWGR